MLPSGRSAHKNGAYPDHVHKFSGLTHAEDAQTPAGAYKHWLTDLPPPLNGVETQQWFPDHPGQRFIAGGLVCAVL